MVFWTTYPFYNVYESLWNRKPFCSQKFEKESIESPTGHPCEIHTLPSIQSIKEIQQYLRTYFGTPPHKPVLDIPVEHLLGKNDSILTVRDNNTIVGTIRYHYIGEFCTSQNEPIYAVDCFCIHPEWRGKGVGDYLLTELHFYVNRNNIPYSMFLKEGSRLSIVHPPLYQGNYVYRATVYESVSWLYTVTVKDAYRMIDIWLEIQPQLFIIRNQDSTNQQWKLYKKGLYTILACIQDAFQTVDGKKIGWITAWIESPMMIDSIREEAARVISNTSGFEYIWMNKVCESTEWTEDGTFYWYSYQWTSAIIIERSYCIIV